MDIEAIAQEAIEKHHAMQREQELIILLKFALWLGVSNILEIGCGAGGMLWAWQEIGCAVTGITLPKDSPEETPGSRASYPLNDHGAYVIYGNSNDKETADKAIAKYDLVFIDGDHTYKGVTEDYANYAPKGNVVALHDIYAHEIDDRCEVFKLWRDIKLWDNGIHLEISATRNPFGIGVVMWDGSK